MEILRNILQFIISYWWIWLILFVLIIVSPFLYLFFRINQYYEDLRFKEMIKKSKKDEENTTKKEIKNEEKVKEKERKDENS
jgi:phosphotransferase system  glucose/maltose/N-acetylglucosamine-specific IIC component